MLKCASHSAEEARITNTRRAVSDDSAYDTSRYADPTNTADRTAGEPAGFTSRSYSLSSSSAIIFQRPTNRFSGGTRTCLGLSKPDDSWIGLHFQAAARYLSNDVNTVETASGSLTLLVNLLAND